MVKRVKEIIFRKMFTLLLNEWNNKEYKRNNKEFAKEMARIEDRGQPEEEKTNLRTYSNMISNYKKGMIPKEERLRTISTILNEPDIFKYKKYFYCYVVQYEEHIKYIPFENISVSKENDLLNDQFLWSKINSKKELFNYKLIDLYTEEEYSSVALPKLNNEFETEQMYLAAPIWKYLKDYHNIDFLIIKNQMKNRGYTNVQIWQTLNQFKNNIINEINSNISYLETICNYKFKEDRFKKGE